MNMYYVGIAWCKLDWERTFVLASSNQICLVIISLHRLGLVRAAGRSRTVGGRHRCTVLWLQRCMPAAPTRVAPTYTTLPGLSLERRSQYAQFSIYTFSNTIFEGNNGSFCYQPLFLWITLHCPPAHVVRRHAHVRWIT